jgi:uncharacterized DUF497 family protein
MEVEWDPNKAAINLQKHDMRFSDAESVLFDPIILMMMCYKTFENEVMLLAKAIKL